LTAKSTMPSEPQTVPLDPAVLAAFRQQGAAIVAHERGLTPVCRIRLAEAAQSLGIDGQQIEEAIRSLAAAAPSAPPHAQTEKFRRRLCKDLSGKSRTIIGPTIEAQIVANAKRKYGLDEGLVGEVLGEVAVELGLTRITSSDAIQSLTAQIDQTIGDSTWLAREGWDRLRSAGGKWGLELEVVDELIDERLAANRVTNASRNFWTQATLFGAAGAVITAGVIVAGLMLARSQNSTSSSPETHDAITTAPRVSSATPTWWDVDLSIDIAQARGTLNGLAGAGDRMASKDASERAAGYEQLLDQVRAASAGSELPAVASRILAGCLALERDEFSAKRLQTALIRLLPAIDAPLPAGSFEMAFWAADTAAAALDRRGGASQRRASVASALSAALNGIPDSAMSRSERQRQIRERTALAAYRQLTAAAAKQPGQVAALYPSLAARATTVVAEDELLRAETTLLVAALPAAGADWHIYERPLVRCIAAPDPLPSLRLIEALRRATDASLVEHLSELLIVRAGARPKSSAKGDVIAAVRGALGGGATLSAADRWFALQDETRAVLASPTATDERELLSQTVLLTHLTTLAIALAQGESGIATFDAGLAHPPQLTPPRDSAAVTAESRATKAGPRTAGKTTARDLARQIETLSKRDASAQAERESALRALRLLAADVPELTPPLAAQVAGYLMAEKNATEQAQVVAALSDLRGWKHLRLAVADSLPSAKIRPDQQREIVAALAADENNSDRSTEDLPKVLLAAVLDDLDADLADPKAAKSGELLDYAAELIAESYRQRAALWNASPAAIASARSPAQALELCLTSLAASGGDRKDPTRAAALEHEKQAARFLAGNDLRLAVALQRLFIEQSAHRAAALRAQHAATARQIAAESSIAFASAPNVLMQLRDQEAAVLKLWMLYAPEI
jgi:hypothetical protein